MIEELFKSKKIKLTNQRREVIDVINNLNDEATIKNIISNCSNIDKSTIYRIIEFLLKENIIEKYFNINDEVYYQLKEGHSHYITCIKCHKKQIIDCPIEHDNELLKDYQVLEHKIEILGICKNCQ